jgi:hypothetical protein
MQAEEDRINHPKMEFYRDVYKDSPRWSGSGGRVIVYCEQGIGDTIQFCRYVPLLKERCDEVVLHCPASLHRLFGQLGVGFIDKDDPDVELPPHDAHVLSMSLPFVLGTVEARPDYLRVPGAADLGELIDFERVGVVWEGNPDHPSSDTRNCPLKHFAGLHRAGRKLVMLQKELHDLKLVAGAEGTELYGYKVADFYDTATLINAVDVVVGVDTAVVHLAGSLGKPTYVMLAHAHDARWDVNKWYDSVKILVQPKPGDWAPAFKTLKKTLDCKKELT